MHDGGFVCSVALSLKRDSHRCVLAPRCVPCKCSRCLSRVVSRRRNLSRAQMYDSSMRSLTNAIPRGSDMSIHPRARVQLHRPHTSRLIFDPLHVRLSTVTMSPRPLPLASALTCTAIPDASTRRRLARRPPAAWAAKKERIPVPAPTSRAHTSHQSSPFPMKSSPFSVLQHRNLVE